ncbi:MAG: rhodanese-like domain-containing protein [Actinomycetales bacterium]|nr:rhodanese-like domain-containing protein [Actinomycetales bacterium]
MILRSRLARAAAVAALGVALASGVAGCSGSTGSSAHATTQSLDAQAFAARASEPGVVILDVRTPEEFATGHLPGAINIDVESGSFTDQVASLDKTATYAVYCRSGNRSAVAMDQMAGEGFTDLADLAGGITAWSQAGGAIVTN